MPRDDPGVAVGVAGSPTSAYGYRAFGGPEVQTFLERDAPVPTPREVSIAVAAAGVNPIDHGLRAGVVPEIDGELPFPQVLGVEAAGLVTAVGAEVSGLAVGDRVFGLALTGAGTYARRAVLLGSATARTPEGLSDLWATTFPVAGATALDALEQLALPRGAQLLVNGSGGGVGLAVAQLARARGLEVHGTASAATHAVVAATGAAFVDYRSDSLVEGLRAQAPAGFDGIVDLVGGRSLWTLAPLAAEPSSIVTTVASAAPIADELGAAVVQRHLGRSIFGRVAELMLAGALDPKIAAVHALDHAAQALAEVESGHALGKTVLDLTR